MSIAISRVSIGGSYRVEKPLGIGLPPRNGITS
jgi:hypothetical protein